MAKRIIAVENKVDILMKDSAEIKGQPADMPAIWQFAGLIFALIRFGMAH